MRSNAAFSPLAAPARVELVLRLADGSPWRLAFSAGMERFIGAYPRLDGIDPGGPLLRFRLADPAA
ncbi:MAG: hypothetical protein ACJ8ER_02395 [Allosphingosinicella sp.]|jgi:hypothetical protein